MFNSTTGLILNNFPSLQKTFCYINIANNVIMINALATLLVVVETMTIMRCFSCMFDIILMPVFHNKLKMYCFTVVYVRSSYYLRHILFLSCLLACFLTFLLYIAVNKVNLPVTRALVRTRTTMEKYIFHSQRIHKPRQLHSTYTSSYIENRA